MTPRYRLGDVVRVTTDVLYPSVNARVPGRGAPWYVVVLGQLQPYNDAFPELRVAPIADDIALASDLDLVLAPGDGPFAVPVLVEVWNQRAMLVANIDKSVGKLSGTAVDRLCKVHNAMMAGGEGVTPEWTGAPIEAEDDPRFVHQQERSRAAEFLSDPVDELLALPARSWHRQYTTEIAITSSTNWATDLFESLWGAVIVSAHRTGAWRAVSKDDLPEIPSTPARPHNALSGVFYDLLPHPVPLAVRETGARYSSESFHATISFPYILTRPQDHPPQSTRPADSSAARSVPNGSLVA